MRKLYFTIICIAILGACNEAEIARTYPSDSYNIKIFEDILPEQSGITFSNTISETEQFNSVTFDGMLQGAGVGILDANNDGLPDIYFASNMGGDKLYLNEGGFKFTDISQSAGIKAENWSTGIAVVDINNDGFDDIYVCKFMHDQESRRQNLFYINKGDGTFVEQAKKMGVADSGYSIMANFFDYDRDGDLDLYIANQPPNSLQLKSQSKGKTDYRFTDRLYKNNNGKFVDVTEQSGLRNYSYSLSATTIDFNKDGWPDLYVACDYDEADFFYKNNGNGTFTNVANSALKHMSNFSMGVDVADINNDGHLDLFVADMVAEDNFRQKTNMSGMNPQRFYALANAGYHYQYMFNSLQLNSGDETFSEIAQLSGVSNTDWSWSPLFIDADQDGYKDLFVTNGLMREMRNKDFEKWRDKFFKQKLKEAEASATKQLYLNPLEIVNKAPSIKISNFGYKNNGDLSFSKVSDQWGISKKTWSQGSAFADFDNDGDLDMVVNNMNMPADLYKNTANDKGLNNYITVELEGPQLNKGGINATIEVTTGSTVQIYENTAYRGYMSSSHLLSHFGLGQSETIDQIKVMWPDNKMNVLSNVKSNQKLIIKHSEATDKVNRSQKTNKLFKSISSKEVVHIENNYDDYLDQILLPYRTSTLGPAIAKGDVDGDGNEDIFVGGAAGQESVIYLNRNKKLVKGSTLGDKNLEVGGAQFFDADNDGDLDLYVASGGSEFKEGSNNYNDRLYTNKGKGQFSLSKTFANITESTSAVLPLDYDSDGDMDLFVGGRQIPSKYGQPASSFILQNNNGQFKNVTTEAAPFLKNFGMVTDAKLVDLNNDKKPELVVAGEWMAIRVFNLGSSIKEVTDQYGLSQTKGWWNTMEIADIDNDGDMDIIAGNLGHNIKYKASPDEPFKVYVDDFDGNGTNDVYLGYYENGQCFPVRGRQCSSQQLPFVSDKFPTYKDFGLATIDKVLEDHLSPTTIVQEAHTFSSTLFLNEGNRFKSIVLPNEVQISPVYGIAVDDFDHDGQIDIFLAGNMYQREVETTRSDAGKGCMISYNSDGTIEVKRTLETGISADRDVRSVETLKSGSNQLLVIANNNDAVQVFEY